MKVGGTLMHRGNSNVMGDFNVKEVSAVKGQPGLSRGPKYEKGESGVKGGGVKCRGGCNVEGVLL